ncbi:hypothetical protein [Gandjariella thermophila]|uniref:DUF8083 domain-containing protein n=1 Tax=Gandjariella thermophila TaxID=1931992 RepID=A0A4D4JCQ7_9PSEU|nr:hypothetical protein [Gandjariella thermophila]GDY32159.1 hypothetical protein GTS_37920 [Gandjariella thermophila]
MPQPFVAYLRVYEPLSAFDAPLAERLREVAERAPLPHSAVGERERELWLRSQLAASPRLLPGELPNGSADPAAPLDVLTLDPADVPVDETATVGAGPLVCPLDVRPRAAAALVGFMASASVPLREVALGVSAETARSRASSVMAELSGGAVHVVSSTWTVPLPWFALFDPEAKHVVLAPRDDPARQVCWRTAMTDARRRTARAHAVARSALGEDGPVRVLRDTGRWLEHFHPHSAVELDYGGLVQLMDDETLLADTSAEDVNAIVAALEVADADEVAKRYERLREFWGDVAAHERYG